MATAEFYRSLSRRRKTNNPRKPILDGNNEKGAPSNGINNHLSVLQQRGEEG